MKSYTSLQILLACVFTFLLSFFGGIYLVNSIFAFFANVDFHYLFNEIWGFYLFIFIIIAVGMTLAVGEAMDAEIFQ